MDAVTIGPTWERDKGGKWLLPERTLGWDVLRWSYKYLRQPDGPDAGTPWRFTPEQARIVLWWYSVDSRGRFVYPYGMLQRLKGWGKDPFGAALCAVEFIGPCRFGGWLDGSTRPFAVPHPAAWVQTAAVSKDQTRNTMTLFPGLFSPEAMAEYGIDLGKEIIYSAYGGRLEAVTSSPRALEGGRGSFVLKNETHHWLPTNDGIGMSDVIRRNSVKSRDGSARALAITNAHVPGENSDAERDWDGYQDFLAGRLRATRPPYLVDSVSAPADTDLADDDSLRAGILAARGDAEWLDVERIMEDIRAPQNRPELSRRFYLNQVTAAEDAYLTAPEWDALANRDMPVRPDDEIVMFFDGSKNDDSTVLVGCRIDDGHVFVIDAWERPRGPLGEGWAVDRADVDRVVRQAMAEREVLAFWGDVAHFETYHDSWSQAFGGDLLLWAQDGKFRHATAWDMSGKLKDFTAACERFEVDVRSGDLSHDGDPRLRGHVLNARRRPNKWGVGIGKEGRESSRKIDLCVAAIGARMLRKNLLESAKWAKRRKRTGKAAFF